MTDKSYPPPCRNYLKPFYLSVTLYACAQREQGIHRVNHCPLTRDNQRTAFYPLTWNTDTVTYYPLTTESYTGIYPLTMDTQRFTCYPLTKYILAVSYYPLTRDTHI